MTLVFGSTAGAYIQFVMPVIAIGAGALIAAGLDLLVAYSMLPSSATTHVINSSGDISRASQAQWIDLTLSEPKLPTVKSAPVHAVLTHDSAKKIVDSNPSAYPLMHDVLYTSAEILQDLHPITVGTVPYIGTIIDLGGGKFGQIDTGIRTSNITNPDNGAPPPDICTVNATAHTISLDQYKQTDSSHYNFGHFIFTYHPTDAPPPVPRPLDDYRSKLGAAPGVSSDVPITNSPLQAEIDKMLQDPNYVPVFTDDTTGLPYAPPPGIPSRADLQAAVDRYNRQHALNESKSGVQAANAGAVAAAQSASDAAHAAAQQAGSAAAANPGDAGLANAYAQAAAGAAAADAALAQAKARQAAADNGFTNMSSQMADEKPLPANGELEAIKSIDFSTLARLNGVVSNTFPLSMLTNVPSYLTPLLSGDVSAPQFDIPLYGDKKFHIDLTPFDPVAAVIRFIMALLISIGMILYVIRFWRGVS